MTDKIRVHIEGLNYRAELLVKEVADNLQSLLDDLSEVVEQRNALMVYRDQLQAENDRLQEYKRLHDEERADRLRLQDRIEKLETSVEYYKQYRSDYNKAIGEIARLEAERDK